MEAIVDYTRMTEEELRAAEKKTRREQLFVSGLVGFMVGVLGFALVTAIIDKSYRLIPILFPSAMLYVFYRMAVRTNQRMTEIREELGKRHQQ